jgi:peptide/nickel transport system permease protein
MVRFLLQRLKQLIPIVFGVATLTFLLLRLSPGDPAYILLKTNDIPPSDEALMELRTELGLTGPLWLQYGRWLTDVFAWRWGISYVSKEPVLTELVSRLPATLELAFSGLLVMVVITLIMGVSTLMFPNRWWDHLGKALALLGATIPHFWLGLILIYFFSVQWGWMPSMGRGGLDHLVLPAVTLGLGMGAVYARILRANMQDIMNQDFIKAARARGLSEHRILLRHVLKQALLPIVTMLGTSLGYMLGGSVIVESIF